MKGTKETPKPKKRSGRTPQETRKGTEMKTLKSTQKEMDRDLIYDLLVVAINKDELFADTLKLLFNHH